MFFLREMHSVLTHLRSLVEDLSLGAAELVGVGAEEAGEEVPAVRRVGEDRVGLEEALGTHLRLAGAGEAVDALQLRLLALRRAAPWRGEKKRFSCLAKEKTRK